MPTIIGTPSGVSRCADILLSIRDQIPDPSADGTAASDGAAFTNATLLRWINDGMRLMAVTAGVITDWYGFPTVAGMDIYELPATTLTVEQLWYDTEPCWPAPEFDALGSALPQGRSFFFGPHSIHATPRIHLSPVCDRTASVTTLGSTISSSATSLIIASSAGWRAWGFLSIGDEIILYRGLAGTTVGPLLRGQAGTTAVPHVGGEAVQERNLVMKVTRLPTPLTSPDDLIELPVSLLPLIELYVLSKVREAEQEVQMAQALRREFQTLIRDLEQRVPFAGIRQGLQVRATPPGPYAFGGRVIIP